jgi:hypothetical protein
MDYLKQILQIVLDPEYTTLALYDSPRVRESFLVVSAYALIYGLAAFLTSYIQSETLSIGVLSFFVVILTTYLLWVVLAMMFHISADLLGGLGEFPHALGFVGLGTIPLVFASAITLVMTLIFAVVIPDDPDRILPNVSLGLTLIGMAVGTPGMVCYFGLKNAEKLHPLKAFAVTFVVFSALTLLLLYASNII